MVPHNASPPSRAATKTSTYLSVVVQAVGALSTFAVALLISHAAGLAAQGRFGLLKGWTDMLVTVCMVGLPQALLHFAYHETSALGRLRRFVETYALALLGLSVIVALVLGQLGYVAWSWVALAIPWLVLHGLLRSLMLSAAGLVPYALVTVAPALAVLVGVGAMLALSLERWDWVIAAAGVVAALVAWVVCHVSGVPRARVMRPLPQGLWHANTHALVLNVCNAAQVALLLTTFSTLGASPTAVGEVSFALYFLQIFAVFAGFVAPALYDHFAHDKSQLRAFWVTDARLVKGFAAVLVVLVVVLVALERWALPLVPAAHINLVWACTIMTLAGLVLFLNRLLATIVQTTGSFAELSRQSLARVVLLMLGAWALHRATAWGEARACAVAMLVVETVLAVRLVAVVRQLSGQALPAVHPSSGKT